MDGLIIVVNIGVTFQLILSVVSLEGRKASSFKMFAFC